MGKRFFVFVIISLVFAANCFSRQISVQIVQHNLSLDYVSEQSLIVEDELMNGFFDKGFIVTNSEAAISTSEEDDDALFHVGFGEAYDGSSDYFVQVKLYYASSSKSTSLEIAPSKLDRVDLIVMKVSSGEKIKESSIKGSDKKPGTDENVRLVSSSLIKEIQKAL